MRDDTLRAGTLARGATRLAFDAVERTTAIVEAMHANIAGAPATGARHETRARGVSGLVYATIRGAQSALGAGVDHALGWLPEGATLEGRAEAETMRSALNGVLGDHLAASDNPLAIPMQLRHRGRRVPLASEALRATLPGAEPRLLLLVHGLCMNDRQWQRDGHDHGAVLERECGFTRVSLLYNSGRRVAENGRDLARLLERLVATWPVPLDEIVILGHSMGGLVARSAVLQAGTGGFGWPNRLGGLVFLGTPHHGAPLERAGSWLDGALGWSRYTAPLGRIGRLRSAGINDLRHGSVHPEDASTRGRDTRVPVPLPANVPCYAVAATLGGERRDLRHLAGDGLVPLASALGRHADPARSLAFPRERRWVGAGMNHFDLLGSPALAEQLVRWLG